MNPEETTLDSWLGGRLTLAQPKRGHRVGSDAALLAAAASGTPQRIVDVGAGVGAVGLALGLRFPESEIALVEIDPALAALARDNATRNGLAARVNVFTCDVTDAKARRAAGLVDGEADLVVTNPPFYEEPRERASPDVARARAHVLPKGDAAESAMAPWFRACTALLASRGRLIVIHRPDRLFDIADALRGRIGGLTFMPIYPKAGDAAHRMLVKGRLGARTPPALAPGLVLHRPDGAFPQDVEALHRGEGFLHWGDEDSYSSAASRPTSGPQS